MLSISISGVISHTFGKSTSMGNIAINVWSTSENLIRFMVSDFCFWWGLVNFCMALLVMINSCVHSISHTCPNKVQYSKMIKMQRGPKALANLVPAIQGSQPFSFNTTWVYMHLYLVFPFCRTIMECLPCMDLDIHKFRIRLVQSQNQMDSAPSIELPDILKPTIQQDLSNVMKLWLLQ